MNGQLDSILQWIEGAHESAMATRQDKNFQPREISTHSPCHGL